MSISYENQKTMCRIGRMSDIRCRDIKMSRQQEKGHLTKDKGQGTRDKRQKDKGQETKDYLSIKNLIPSEFDAFDNSKQNRSLSIFMS
ncbi:MAG: hypothetical protein RL632_681 [Bacteroidota bacterium]